MNSTANSYNYARFSPKRYDFDKFNSPAIGEQAPDFSATTPEGEEVMLSGFLGQPVVLEIGSITCPVYAGVSKIMNDLAESFADIRFILLYVREAHPGERCGAHKNMEEKLKRARETRRAYGENRTILVDDLKGTAHQLYGAYPNSLFVIDENGIVVWRTKWNRPQVLSQVLDNLKAGKQLPPELMSEKPGGSQFDALLKGGWVAVWDFLIAFPTLIWQKFIRSS